MRRKARPFDERRATDYVEGLLEALGQDRAREGLRETPRRVVAFYRELLTPKPFTFTTFASEGVNELIVQTGIQFYSLCEHHLLPFFGTAAVGYVPNGRIVGLSKLARCVRFHAAGLMNQERITQAVADQIRSEVEAKAVGVVLRARHLCMEMRGVCAPGAETTTSCLRGNLYKDPRARAEFIELARSR